MSSEKNIEKGRRISIDLTAPAAAEVDRLRKLTGLTTADIFRHALALFRIYVQSQQAGDNLAVVGAKGESVRQIEFPLVITKHDNSEISSAKEEE